MKENILEMIGKSPLVRLHSMVEEGWAEVLVKVESTNPGGSIKDRPALAMILEAEKQGLLKRGDTIIEPTSGNMGIALAMVGATRGYKVILVMPETMSLERRKLMLAYGASILLTEGSKGMQGSVDEAVRLSEEQGYYMPYQFENPANARAHFDTTGPEIYEETGGRVDAFVAGVGTGGTVSGVGGYLKMRNPEILIAAVEPEASPVLRGGEGAGHGIQGIGANFVPGIYDSKVVDEVLGVETEDAVAYARRLAREEGILSGISSGANVYGALQLAKRLGKDKVVVTVLPDTGERYLSTELFNE